MRSGIRRTRGFAIVSAIFILVVLAALGAFIVNISTTQHIGSALDVQGVRAYQAARAGIEWGVFQVQSSNGFDYANPNTRTCPAAATSSFAPAGTTLSSFTITVTCNVTADANNGPSIYRLVATACSEPVAGWTATTTACPNTANPGSMYIERRLEVLF